MATWRSIFCPTCGELALDVDRCPTCGAPQPDEADEPSGVVWRAELGFSLPRPRCYPAIAAGNLCVPTEDGHIVAVNVATGAKVWEYTLPPHSVTYTLASDGARVFVGPYDTRAVPGPGRGLIALDGATGALLWTYTAAADSFSGPMVLRDTVFTTTSDGHIHAVDAATGVARWVKPNPGWGPGAGAVADGVVVAGGRADVLLGYDAASGREAWRFHGGGWFATRPAIVDGVVAARCWDGMLYGLDLASGALRWKVPGERGHGFTSPPGIGPGLVLIGDRVSGPSKGGYALRALDAASGAERWRFPVPKYIQVVPASVGDLILCPADGRNLFGIGVNGEQRWQIDLPANPTGRPALAAGRAYVADEAGGVTAVRAVASGAGHPAPEELLLVGDHAGAAAAYVHSGNLTAAAELYEQQLAMPAAAARLYERASRPGSAAPLWVAAGELQRARAAFEAAGDMPNLAELLITCGESLEAAAIFEQMGELKRAAQLFEQAGHNRRAAECYEQAAQQAQASGTADSWLLAGLYEQAARLYGEIFDTDRAEACALEVRRHRRLPSLEVSIDVEQAFSEEEWSTATASLRNTGFGPARSIQLQASDRFELGETPLLAGIAAGREANLTVSLRPRAGQLGRVPLSVSAVYLDNQEASYKTPAAQVLVRVHPRGFDPSAVTPASVPNSAVIRAGEGLSLGEVPLTMRFDPHGDSVEITWEADILGVRASRFTPPFKGPDLELVVRTLDLLQYPSSTLAPHEVDRLRELGLPTDDTGLDPLGHRAVGRLLFKALIADPRGAMAIGTVRDHARHQGKSLALRLRFPPEAIELAALPWELLWDEGPAPFLLGQQRLASCTRHLDLSVALPPSRPRAGALRILAITPHAGIEPDQRERERAERTASWAPLIASGEVVMEELGPATRRDLVDRLLTGPAPDIIHFVGHGRYADGEGWLILDRPDGGWDRVPAHRLLPLFGDTRLVVLCACQGGMVGEGGLLTGVAPALSAAGVPAVVAMQLTVRATAAARFSEVLYRALARGESVQRAVVQARQALYIEEADAASWYVPTLTIRARDPGPLYLLAG